ncbi:MAG: glycerate kinase [Planctomycetota bacterium]|jgi:glycerate kinase
MERPGDGAIVSTLDSILAQVEAGLSRLVTTLESESPTEASLAKVTEGYEAACHELEVALEGLAVLPVELRPTVEKVVKLQAIARHLVSADLVQTGKGLMKVRAARTAIGRNPQANLAVFGSTGVDCNIRG